MLRFLCHADGTPVGQLALRYADAMLEAGLPYRLMSLVLAPLQDMEGSGWERHRDAFSRELVRPWTNVVCAPRQGPLQSWRSLRTAGVRNVLITDEKPTLTDAAICGRAGYDMVIVPSPELGVEWSACRETVAEAIRAPIATTSIHVIPPGSDRLAEILSA